MRLLHVRQCGPHCTIPLLGRSFTGRRDEKTFTIRGESASACEGRRYIVMEKYMHVSRSMRGSAMVHVVSARVCPILLACARGELLYVSDIEEIRYKVVNGAFVPCFVR